MRVSAIKKAFVSVLIAGLLLSVWAALIAPHVQMKNVQAAKTESWNDIEYWGGLGGFIPNSSHKRVGDSVVVSTVSAGEMSSGNWGMPFVLNGLKIKFKVDKAQSTGNLKFMFTPYEGWYNDNPSAFTIDFAHGAGNRATIQQNIKYPGGGANISHPRAGIDCDFYWDGSSENVFEIKLENGILHFYLNGTDLGSDDKHLETQRLIDLGILDFFIDGSGYFTLWHQSSGTIEITFNDFVQTFSEPKPGVPEGSGWVAIDDTGLTSYMNGVGQTRLIAESGDYAVKYTRSSARLNNAAVKLSVAAEQETKYGIFFDSKAAASHGEQLRLYITNNGAGTGKVEVCTFDGVSEMKLGETSAAFPFTSTEKPDFGKTVEVRIKRLTLAYQLYINDVLVPVSLHSLTDFIDRYFENELAYIVLSNFSAPTKTHFYWFRSFVSAAASPDWKAYGEDPEVVLADDNGMFQAYSTDNGGAFSVYNNKQVLWPDAFGLQFHLDKIDKTNADAFRIILSSVKDNFYAENDSPALLLDFALAGANAAASSGYNTSVTIRDGRGNELGSVASTERFYWDYEKPNAIYFGKEEGVWVLDINDYRMTIAGESFQTSVDAYMNDNFGGGKAYLQFRNLGGKATSVSVIGVKHGIPTGQAPRGWIPGVTTGPQWITPTVSGEAAFTTSGQSFSLQNIMAAPLEDFKMVLKMAPGTKTFAASMVFNCGGSMWYSDAFAIGFHLSWSPSVHGFEYIQVGVLLYKPDEMLVKNLIFTRQVAFNWFGDNTFEFKTVRGAHGLYLNGENLFETNTYNGRTFSELFADMSSRLQNNESTLQIYAEGEATYVIKEINTFAKSTPPVQVPAAINALEEQIYAKGKTITVDLSTIFNDNNGLPLTYTADKGEVDGNVWTYTPDSAGEHYVTFKASNGLRDSLPVEICFTVEAKKSKGCKNAVATTASAGLAAGLALLLLGMGGIAAKSFMDRKRWKR